MIIHHGGVPSGYRKTGAFTDQNAEESAATKMYAVHGATPLSTMAHEVQPSASNLSSGDCFVVLSANECFVFNGAQSTVAEKAVARNVAEILVKGKSLTVIEEGSEPDKFWQMIGGKADYLRSGIEEEAARDPRLFVCSTETGRFTVEEIDDYNQSDLDPEAVMLLDTYAEVFIWVGFHASAEEESKALELAKNYITASSLKDHRHPGTPVIRIESGHEPTLFKRYFIDWDEDYFNRHKFIDPYEAKLSKMKSATESVSDGSLDKSSNVTVTSTKTYVSASSGSFSYAELKAGVPPGVDPEQKEAYLSDTEFSTIFGMTRAAFAALPRWKRDAKKKQVHLF